MEWEGGIAPPASRPLRGELIQGVLAAGALAGCVLAW